MRKRILSIMLTVCLLTGLVPTAAFAEDTMCEHHTEHTADCGYKAAVDGQECNHIHNDDCGYIEAAECGHEHTQECGENGEGCTHEHNEECGYVKGQDCTHEHDGACGYVEASEGSPCAYVCDICNNEEQESGLSETVTAVQELIDAIPYAEDITEDNFEDIADLLGEIDTLKAELTDEEREQLDFTKYDEAVAVMMELMEQGGAEKPALMASCTCLIKCTETNNDCPVCKSGIDNCTGRTKWVDIHNESIVGYIQLTNLMALSPSYHKGYYYALDWKIRNDGDSTILAAVPAGADVVIDLNGNTLDGNNKGTIFEVAGKLTIIDTKGGGRILKGSDGAIHVLSGGSVIMQGGTIENCVGSGAVTVDSGGKFEMTGGTIKNNKIVAFGREGSRNLTVKGSSTVRIGGDAQVLCCDAEECSCSGSSISININYGRGGVKLIPTLYANSGTIKGTIYNEGIIAYNGAGYGTGTKIYGTVDNFGTIDAATSSAYGPKFHAAVTNNGSIVDGIFHSSVTNNGTISGGSFTSSVTNNGTISGGTFLGRSTVINEGTVSGGTFTGNFDNRPNGIIEDSACIRVHAVTPTGEVLETKRVFRGKIVSSGDFTTPNPITYGYNFFGYWLDEDEGVPLQSYGRIFNKDDSYIRAVFKDPINYTIEYFLQDGVADNPLSYTVETETFTLNNPTKNGYDFTGWSGTGLEGSDNMTVTVEKGSTGNRRYVANYTEKGYTITFQTNGADYIAPITNLKWDTLLLGKLPTPTLDGYTFKGWKCGDKPVTAETRYSDLAKDETVSSIELTAQWSSGPLKQPVSFNRDQQTYTYDGKEKAFVIEGTELGGFSISYKQNGSEVSNPTNPGPYDVTIIRPSDDEYQEVNTTIHNGLVIEATAVSASFTVTEPVLGAKRDMKINVKYDPADFKIGAESVAWYQNSETKEFGDNKGWVIMNTDEYNEGIYYAVVYGIAPMPDGFKFSEDTVVNINGKIPDFIDYIKDDNDNIVAIRAVKTFDMLISDVTKIAVTVDEPVIGKKPDFEPEYTAYIGDEAKQDIITLKEGSVKWIEYDQENNKHEMGSDDVFKADCTYGFEMTVGAEQGYCLTSGTTAELNGETCTVTLNDDGSVTIKSGKITPLQPGPVEITSIAVTVDAPIVGYKPDFTPEYTAYIDDGSEAEQKIIELIESGDYRVCWWECNKEDYENDKISAYDKPWSSMTERSVFCDGFYYSVDMYFEPNDGYCFTAATQAAVNGKPHDNTYGNIFKDDNTGYAYVNGLLGLLVSEPVEITSMAVSIDAPKLGKTADYSPEITSTPENSASHYQTIWYKLPKGDYTGANDDPWELMDKNEEFKEGYYYSVLVGAAENNGFYFTNTTTAALNGRAHVDTFGPVYSDDYEDGVARIYGVFKPLRSESSSDSSSGNSGSSTETSTKAPVVGTIDNAANTSVKATATAEATNTAAADAAKNDATVNLVTATGTTVSGDGFTEPAILSIPADTNGVKNVNNLTLARLNPETGKLEVIGGTYNAETQSVTGYIDEAGDYFVIEKDGLITITLQIGNTDVILNNNNTKLDAPPIISQERTLLPVRFIAESLGAQVGWDEGTRTVSIEKDGKILSMQIDKEIEGFGAAPIISNNRTMVPARYISEQFGANVLWVPSTQTISIAGSNTNIQFLD
ncbi:MAG: stalk domain-containing protein [Clostridia bacterium]|nr:stalk domain-containing protein [Clostridia bacterium]